MIVQIVGAVLLLGILIFVHELGHFLAMKAFGVKVLKFSLGFGRPLPGMHFKRGETEYQVGWLPIGGFVKALGEDPDDVVDVGEQGRALREVSRWKQIIIYAAGPVFNLILPLLVFFLVYLGIDQRAGSFIGEVFMDSPAAAAGFEIGDRITAVDGHPVRYWEDLQDRIQAGGEVEKKFTVERDGRTLELLVGPARRELTDRFGDKHVMYQIGISKMFRPAILGVEDPASPAHVAGLRTGDRVLEADGEPVERFHQLGRMLEAARDRPVVLKVARLPFPRYELEPDAERPEPDSLSMTLPAAVEGGDALRGIRSGDLFIGRVKEDGIAAQAGIQPGDRIVEVQDKAVPAWDDFAQVANQVAQEGQPVNLVLSRIGEGIELSLSITGKSEENELGRKVKVYEVGAYSLFHNERRPSVMVPNQERLGFAVYKAWFESWGFVELTVRGIWKMITGEISTKGLGGPIMIFQVAARAAEAGLAPWLRILGLISIALGLLNLIIPIPILDSGQILILLIESARRKPVSDRVREYANLVGFSLLILLMVLATWNDVARIFAG